MQLAASSRGPRTAERVSEAIKESSTDPFTPPARFQKIGPCSVAVPAGHPLRLFYFVRLRCAFLSREFFRGPTERGRQLVRGGPRGRLWTNAGARKALGFAESSLVPPMTVRAQGPRDGVRGRAAARCGVNAWLASAARDG